MPELDHSQTFNSIVTVASRGLFRNEGVIAHHINNSRVGGTVIKNIYERKERTNSDALHWLSPLDYLTKQEECEKMTAPNTGQWLLNSEAFMSWRSKKTHKLWCVGMPGAGKTILASIVISHLKKSEPELGSPKPVVAYLYLTYGEQPPLEHLLGSVARQLLDPLEKAPSSLRKLWKDRDCVVNGTSARQDHPPLEEVDKILVNASRNRDVYIIVDALDEYALDLRDNLIHHLLKIKEDINLFVTSRSFEGFDGLAQDFTRLDIEARSQDIQEYIDHVIENRSRLRKLISRDPDLRRDIGTIVTQKSSQMFLLVKFHMDAIAAQSTLWDVRRELETLPENLWHIYGSTMDRIRRQEPSKCNYAIQILSWIVWASRPLSEGEMLHALAVEEGDTHFQKHKMLIKQDLEELCCGLVVVDETNTVRLVHYTAQSYFADHKGAELPDFHRRIASTCVSYLYMLSLQKSNILLKDQIEMYPLARYAGEYLDRHIREVRNEPIITNIAQDIRQLLEKQHQSDYYHNLLLELGLYYRTTKNLLEKQVQLNWLKRLLQKMGAFDDPGHRNRKLPASSQSTTELHLAVFLGCTLLVCEYIRNGKDVEALDQFRNSAMAIAFEKNDDEIMTILLEHGVHVDLSTESGHSFLLCAARKDLWDTVQGILREAHGGEYKAANDPSETQDKPGLQSSIPNQAGSSSAEGGSGQGSNTRTNLSAPKPQPPRKLRRHTRFLFAAYNGDVATMTALIEHHKVDPAIMNGRTPLKRKWARFVRTACFLAVERCHVDTLKKLLDYRIDPDTRDFEHRTLLHRAVECNNLEITKLLLERNASPQLRDARVMAAWAANATPDRDKILELLKKNGANPNDKDGLGVNILYGAAAGGDVQKVEFLLGQGVNPSLRTMFGWAPLHWAANNGHLECVRLLLEWKAELSPVSDQGTTPLDQARNNKQDAIADMLERAGAETAQSIYAKRRR